jgi:dTDP-4-amino-4,6-dideoxygalactose transaminase
LGETERLCRKILSLPVHPMLTERQVHYAAGIVADWAGDRVAA